MQAQTFKTWIARRIAVPTRLQQVCVHYLLFLMVATRKHSFTEAARFSGLNKSVFCKLLRDHFRVCPTFYTWCFDSSSAAHEAGRHPCRPRCQVPFVF
jgi:hypothetical protein